MSYQIRIQDETGLWIVLFNSEILGRGAAPITAINFARTRVEAVNNPVTGRGPGSIPPLTTSILNQLLAQAESIEQERRQQFEVSKQDQGPSTVSSGVTTADAAAARDDLAVTQSPTTPAQEVTATGQVSTSSSITLPSNAVPSQVPTPVEKTAPQKLSGPADVASVPAAQGNQTSTSAQQLGGSNLDTPDENTNQVSYIYRAIQCTSNFRQGKFTQELQGAQIFFPITTQQQQSPNAGRVANQSATAAADRAGARPQGTVRQVADTPGVDFSLVTTPSQFELEGFGDPTISITAREPARAGTVTSLPGSIQGARNLGGPTAEQVPVTAPLRTEPPTTGTSNITPVSPVPLNNAIKTTQGASRETSLQDQLRLARNNKASFEKSLAQVDARIARREGNPLNNRDMRSLYASNLAQENRIIADLEQQLARPIPAAAPSITVTPQSGAKDY